VQDIVIAITDQQSAAILPKHYTGFIASSHANYKLIEDAGIAVGALKNQK
jgi:phosphonate transport system substrate-binding protein